MKNAHLLINIDRLSESPDYRGTIRAQLKETGITGIDFSDCLIPQALYLTPDRNFFTALEDKVHEWLEEGGWSQKDLTKAKTLRRQFEPTICRNPVETLNQHDLAEQVTRARSLVRRFETDAAVFLREGAEKEKQTKTHIAQVEAKAQQAEAKTQKAEAKAQHAKTRVKQAETRAQESHAKAQQAEARAEQAENMAQVYHAKAQQAEAALKDIYNSRSWGITAPLRSAGKAVRWFGRGSIAWLTFKPGCRPRRIVRSALISIKYTISAHPRLKVVSARLLSFFPHLDARLRLIGNPHVHLIRRAQICSPTEDCLMGGGSLSPMARKIYFDLKAAIEQYEKEQV